MSLLELDEMLEPVGQPSLMSLRRRLRWFIFHSPKFEDCFGPALIAALGGTYQSSACPIKALVLSNAHNPLGRCYSSDVLEQCPGFCQRHELYFISDEVFTLSVFTSPELVDPSTFVSALSLRPKLIDCDPERVHVVWSMAVSD